MIESRFARCAVALAGVVAALATAPRSADRSSARFPDAAAMRERAAGRDAVPFGAPSAAMRYATAKRLPIGRSIDTRAAYRRAETHAAAMPLYSIAEDRYLPPSRARGQLKGKWKPLGPGNVGGRTRRIVIDPTAPSTIYVGGVSGGVWKTTDGTNWRAVGDDLANVAVNSMAMLPGDSQTLIVGTGEGYFREDVRGTGLPLRGGGIFRTRDGAGSWEMLASTDTEDFWFVNDLVYSADGARIYAATRTGVLRSIDDGNSWESILDPDVQGGCLDLAIRDDTVDDVLFASCGTFEQATVYRTVDGAARGEVAFEAVLSDAGMGRTSIALAPSDQDVIYALAASNEPGFYEQALHAVFRSTAGGAAGTWAARLRNSDADVESTLLLHNPLIARYQQCGVNAANITLPMGWYVNALGVDPADPDIVWAAGVDWFRSDDGGSDWGPASFYWAGGADPAPSYTHADQHGIAFHPDYDGVTNRTLYIVNDGGVWRGDDGRAPVSAANNAICDWRTSQISWQSLNNNLGITQFYHGEPFPEGDAYLGGTQDNGTQLRPRNGGADGWIRIFGGDGGYVAIDPRDTDVLYIEFQSGNIRKSIDGGFNFTSVRNGLPASDGHALEPDGNFVFITPFVMDPSAPDRLWIGAREVYRTDDGAAQWSAASRPTKGRVSAIAVAPSDPDRVVVGTESGFVHRTDRALSATGSTPWQRRRPRQAWATWVAVDPVDPQVIYVTYGGFGGPHVYRSDDFGRSWSSIDGSGATGLPDIPVHVLVVDPDDTSRLFIGTDLGVFVTVDGGASWAQENAGFGQIVTESLTLQEEGSKLMLYAFTHGRGAWRVKVRRAG